MTTYKMYVGYNSKNQLLLQTLSMTEFDVQCKLLSEIRSNLKESKQDVDFASVNWNNYKYGYTIKPVAVTLGVMP